MSPVISEGRPPFQKFSRPWRTDEHELSLTNLPVESLKSWFANWSPRKFVFGSDTDVAQLPLTNCHTNIHARAFRTLCVPREIVNELCIPWNTESTFFIISPLNRAGKYTRENNRINFEYLLSVNKRFIDHSGNFHDHHFLWLSIESYSSGYSRIEFYEQNSLPYRLMSFCTIDGPSF